MRVSTFGCTKPEHLVQRINTHMPVGAAIDFSTPHPANMAEAIERVESALDIQLFDCHVNHGEFYKRAVAPSHNVQVVLRSTVQPKAKARVTVSPETYVAFINDMESSGLWEYEGETP